MEKTATQVLNFGILAALLTVIVWQRADMRRLQDSYEKLGNRLADLLDKSNETVAELYLPPRNHKP